MEGANPTNNNANSTGPLNGGDPIHHYPQNMMPPNGAPLGMPPPGLFMPPPPHMMQPGGAGIVPNPYMMFPPGVPQGMRPPVDIPPGAPGMMPPHMFAPKVYNIA